MKRHYIFKGDFDYLAYHGSEEITAVLVDSIYRPSREFQGTIEDGDKIFIKNHRQDRFPTIHYH